MAFCTKCGTVMADDDAPRHECIAGEVPAKGTVRKIKE